MSKKTQLNPLSMPLMIVSMTTLIATSIAASFDSLNWLMAYLIWGCIASFGLFTIWTVFSVKAGVTSGLGAQGRLYKVYRSKEPKFFIFLITFYLLFGCVGFASILFIVLSK